MQTLYGVGRFDDRKWRYSSTEFHSSRDINDYLFLKSSDRSEMNQQSVQPTPLRSGRRIQPCSYIALL
jgi:hypothetical protein